MKIDDLKRFKTVLVLSVAGFVILPLSLIARVETQIEIVNGEKTGYIQVAVDGVDYVYSKKLLVRDDNGNIKTVTQKKTWKVGPGDSILVKKTNWSGETKSVSILVKYFRDDDGLIGVSEPRIFSLDARLPQHHQWVFHKSDVERR